MRRVNDEGILERNISARVSAKTYMALKKESESADKTISTLVREIAEKHVEEKEED